MCVRNCQKYPGKLSKFNVWEISYPRATLSRPLWISFYYVREFLSFPTVRSGNAMFLFEAFVVCFLIFEIELKPARFIDSSVSSRIFFYSEIYDHGLTFIYNINFFDDIIFRSIIFRKEVSLFSKMAQAKNDPFSVSPWRKWSRDPALNFWRSVSRHINIKIETVQ